MTTHDDKVREQAEQAYIAMVFDFVSDPIGSRDWTLFLRGFQSALSTVSEAAQEVDNPCPLCDGHGTAPVWVKQPVSRDDVRDAELLRAMADEWDRAKRDVDSRMPIWDALCDAIGDNADGNGMRTAIAAAKKEEEK